MSELDQIDERLIKLLSEDAQLSSRRLAVRLSVSAATANRRMKELLQSGALRFVAVRDPYQTGLPVAAVIGMKVDPNRIGLILRTLSQKPRCGWVSATAGRFDILVVANFHSNDDLAEFTQNEVSKIDGVRDIETFICFHVQATILRWRGTGEIHQIDGIDERLIELLSEDARQSSERLAVQLSLSAATVRRRSKRLLQSGALRIVAVPNPYETGQPIVAVIALKVDHGRIEGILSTLEQKPQCRWVSATTGRFDILVIARFRSTDDLFDFIQNEIAKANGIRNTETFICLRVQKSIYVRRA